MVCLVLSVVSHFQPNTRVPGCKNYMANYILRVHEPALEFRAAMINLTRGAKPHVRFPSLSALRLTHEI
jgi:hypothetical protein